MQKSKLLSTLFVLLVCVSTPMTIFNGNPEVMPDSEQSGSYGLTTKVNIHSHSVEYLNDSLIRIAEPSVGVYEFFLTIQEQQYHFYIASIRKEIYEQNNEIIKQIYRFDNFSTGFFAELHQFSTYYWFNLAFSTPESQYELNYVDTGVLPLHSNEVSTEVYDEEYKPIPNAIAMMDFLNERVRADLIIVPITSGPKSASLTNYGLLHQCQPANSESQFSSIESDIEDNSGISDVISRYNPTRATVLADIQYYSLDVFKNYNFLYQRNLRAYEIVCSSISTSVYWKLYGNKHLEGFSWTWDYYGQITPSDIEDLWGTEMQGNGEEWFYYPSDCIVLAYGSYTWGATTLSNPDMGDAWVDYGADAFVGSICSISYSTAGDYSDDFWDALTTGNDDVEQATTDLCSEGGWTLDTHWKILGSATASLP